jgi:hypothetical protein
MGLPVTGRARKFFTLIPVFITVPVPESIVINDFYAKIGTLEGVEQQLPQVASFTLVTNNFCRLPVLFIE